MSELGPGNGKPVSSGETSISHDILNLSAQTMNPLLAIQPNRRSRCSFIYQAIVVGTIATAIFSIFRYGEMGGSDREIDQRVLAGVADPVVSCRADLPQESPCWNTRTPPKPFFEVCLGTEASSSYLPRGFEPTENSPQVHRDATFAIPNLAESEKDQPFPTIPCQALGPAAPCPICAVDGSQCRCRGRGWNSARVMNWQAYAQGEYVGHARTVHVQEYRLRVDDQLDMVYRVTRQEQPDPYRLNVGDEISVESFTDSELNRNLLIQPDGTITLRLLGQVHATGRTVTQLRDSLEELYKKYYKTPSITVTPLKVNTKLEDLRATVDRRAGLGGQSQIVRVTPEGTVSLPAIGSVRVQGLTLSELQQELNERYRQVVEGMEVIPVLAQRAPRYVYVLGEVNVPGRFELTGPTTAIQAISMAQGWRVGANLRQIVVFRRGDDWRLLATMINLESALAGNQPTPKGEIWLDDSDVIIVPKSAILRADDFIDLVFTRGIYGVFPISTTLNFSKLSTL